MLKRNSIGWAIWNAIEGLLLVVAGILCMVWSGNTDFQKVAILVAGIMVIVDAGLRLLLGVIEIVTTENYDIVKTNTSQAIAGAAELSLGISLCYIFANYNGSIEEGIAPAKNVFGYIGIYMGVALIIIAALIIIHALIFIMRRVYSIPRNMATIGFGALVLILGIVALVYLNPAKGDNVIHFFLLVFGLIATTLGAVACGGSIFSIVAAKRLQKADEEIREEESNRPVQDESEEKPEETPEEKPED